MAEHTIVLYKKSGGSTLTGPDGEQYNWPKNDAGLEVPYDWALDLLRIPDGGFYVKDQSVELEPWNAERNSTQSAADAGLGDSAEGKGTAGPVEVTEPAPAAEASVTEPAPAPQQDARPITPRPKGGTATRK